MDEPTLSHAIIILLQVSIMLQMSWELKNGIMPPLWVLLPRVVAVTAPLLIFLK